MIKSYKFGDIKGREWWHIVHFCASYHFKSAEVTFIVIVTVYQHCVKVLFRQGGYRQVVGVWLCHLEPTKWVVSKRWNAGVCWAFKLAVFSSETSMARAPRISLSGRPAVSMRGGALKCWFVVLQLNISLSPQLLHYINGENYWREQLLKDDLYSTWPFVFFFVSPYCLCRN